MMDLLTHRHLGEDKKMSVVYAIFALLGGIGIIFFGKGVLTMRALGDSFNADFFYKDNKQRLIWALLGGFCFSVVIYLDPAGYSIMVGAITTHYSETLGNFLGYGSPTILGMAIGGATLMTTAKTVVDKKKVINEEIN